MKRFATWLFVAWSVSVSAQAVFVDAENSFYSINFKTCEIIKLFQIDIPEDMQPFTTWISGITFLPNGDFFGVDGFNLFKFGPGRGLFDRLESITPDDYQYKRWMTITSDNDGLLYFGAFGWYVFDPLLKTFISKPKASHEQEYRYFLGSDISYLSSANQILNLNTWNRRFDYISLPSLAIEKSYVFDTYDDNYWHFRTLSQDVLDCGNSTLYGFDYKSGNDFSILYEILDVEKQIYEPRCTIPVKEITGFTNPYIYAGKPRGVAADHLAYDFHGGYSISVYDFCSSVTLGETNMGFKMCYDIDSIIFVHSNATSIISDFNLVSTSDSSFLWINQGRITSDEVLDIIRNSSVVTGRTNEDQEELRMLIFSGLAKTQFFFNFHGNPEKCGSYEDQLVYFPNAFTPNGDGVNDWYKYFPLAHVKIKKFEIFDKFSRLVFESSGDEPFWPGPADLMTSDVYVYACEFEDTLTSKTYFKTGSIHVVL